MLTTIFTISGGVLIFLCEKIISNILKKKDRYIEIKSKIAISLKFYANLIHNPLQSKQLDNYMEYRLENFYNAKKDIRKLAMELDTFSNQNKNSFIRWYIGLSKTHEIEKAKRNLVGISNALIKDNLDKNVVKNNKERKDIIIKSLELEE